MAGGRPYDEHRFRELLMLVLHEGVHERIKLALIMWRIDFDAYAKLGQSITGATYIKRPEGPWPAPFDRVLAELIAEGRVALVPRLGRLARFAYRCLVGCALANGAWRGLRGAS